MKSKGQNIIICITFLILSTLYLSSCGEPAYVVGNKFHVQPKLMFTSYYDYLKVYPNGIPEDFVYELTALNDDGHPSYYKVYIPTDEGLKTFNYEVSNNDDILYDTIINGIPIQITNVNENSRTSTVIRFKAGGEDVSSSFFESHGGEDEDQEERFSLIFNMDTSREVSKPRDWPKIAIDMVTFDGNANQIMTLSLTSNRLTQQSFYYTSSNEKILLSNETKDYSYTYPKDFIEPENDELSLRNVLNGMAVSYQDKNYRFDTKYVSPDGYYAEGTWSFFGSSGTFKVGFSL